MADQMMGFVLRAAKDNDVNVMEQLLKIDKTLAKAKNQIGQTGLHVAAIWGNLEVALMLIDAGADINAQNQFGVTPLASAAGGDKPQTFDMVKFLLDEGADPNICAANGAAPFEVAKTDAVRTLLGGPLLKGHDAVIAADCLALQEALNEGLDVSAQDRDRDTILHLAVKAATGEVLGDEPMVEEVADQTRTGNLSMLDLLLKHDTAVGFQKAQRAHNKAGQVPLHIAAAGGNAAICDALLQANAPRGLVNIVSIQNDELHNGQWGKKNANGELERLSSAGSTALHQAVQLLHDRAEAAEDAGEEVTLDPSLVRVLLKHGANPNSVDAEEQTPLHIAIMGGLHEVVQILCEAKADLSLGCKAFGKDGTELHQAVILRDIKMIKLLAEHGAKVDVQGRDGWTPLCLAVRSNAVATARALLEAKANPDAVSGNGKTALEVAKLNSKSALVDLLEGLQLS